MLCIYIAITVNSILKNQTRLNDARYEQIKKLQEDIVNLKTEIRSIKQDDLK
jgi:hypothetical protein